MKNDQHTRKSISLIELDSGVDVIYLPLQCTHIMVQTLDGSSVPHHCEEYRA